MQRNAFLTITIEAPRIINIMVFAFMGIRWKWTAAASLPPSPPPGPLPKMKKDRKGHQDFLQRSEMVTYKLFKSNCSPEEGKGVGPPTFQAYTDTHSPRISPPQAGSFWGGG